MRTTLGNAAASVTGKGRDVAASGPLVVAIAGLAYLAALNPMLGIGVAVAIGLFMLALRDLVVGAVGFLALQFVAQSLPVPQENLARLLGVGLVASWLVAIFTLAGRRRPPSLASEHPAMVAAMGAFIVWGLTSMTWAIDSALVLPALQRYALSMILVVVLFAASPTRETARRIAIVLVLSIGVSALFAIALGLQEDGGRLSGGTTDPNEFAMTLVPAVVMGPALALRSHGVLRWLLFISSAVGALSIMATQSRGGLIALAGALLAFVVFGGRWRGAVAVVVLALALFSATYIEAFASPQARSRIETVFTVGGNASASSAASTGRTDIWAVGWRAFDAHPIAGAGLGGFTRATPRYVFEAGLVRRTDLIFATPKVAHNLYLHLLVEVGIVGLAFFLCLVVASLVATRRAIGRFAAAGDRDMELLARAVLASTLGLLAASFFLSSMFSRILWVGLALGPILAHAARSSGGPSAGARSVDVLERRGQEGAD